MATIILIVTNYVSRSYLKRKSINFAHGSGNKVRCAQGSKTEGVCLMIGHVLALSGRESMQILRWHLLAILFIQKSVLKVTISPFKWTMEISGYNPPLVYLTTETLPLNLACHLCLSMFVTTLWYKDAVISYLQIPKSYKFQPLVEIWKESFEIRGKPLIKSPF